MMRGATRTSIAARGALVIGAGLAAAWLVLCPLSGAVEPLLADYRADVHQSLSPRAEGQFRYIESELRKPFEGYSAWQTLGDEFKVVALSHMACGLANVALDRPDLMAEIAPLLDEVARRAMSADVSPVGSIDAAFDRFDDHNLYLSHLNLILGLRRMIAGRTDLAPLQQRISSHLAERSAAGGDFHAPSYPGSPCFPADQTVTLASLAVQEHNLGTHTYDGLVAGWLGYMRTSGVAPGSDLPRSSLDPTFHAAELPRGCALSWSALYMAQFAPEAGAELYAKERAEFFQTTLGFGGFREWPRGAERGMDFDSGPVIGGLGMAATAFGLGAARIYGDADAYRLIMRSASIGAPTVWSGERHYAAAPLLGNAILLHALTARPWFTAPPHRDFANVDAFPSASLILIACWLIPVALCGWILWLQVRWLRRAIISEPESPLLTSTITAAPTAGAHHGASRHAGL